MWKVMVFGSAVLLVLSSIAGVVWWVRITASGEPLVLLMAFGGTAQLFSWSVLAVLLCRAWRVHTPWLIQSAALLCLGLLLANLLYGFFTPVVGAAFAFVIGAIGTGLLAIEARDRARGESGAPAACPRRNC